ncbi:MAG: hypothetical protein PHV33_03805 [Elusimicrobiales bacterium]|nr:hypothetical protein [Elusimicrobiales bacterium]
MGTNRAKFDCQVRLVASLKEFAGPVPAGFFNHKEFFIVTLQRLAANLYEFKEENLRALAADLLEKLRRGPLSPSELTAFKDMLDKLVSGRDYMTACAGLAGSREFAAERLARLRPLSIAAEEQKLPGEPRDPTADRLVGEAYRRLRFDSLEEEHRKGRPEDRALQQARAQVAEYCLMYRLPLCAEDTLPPFSLSRIDAVTGACFRLLGRLGRAAR